MRGIRSRRRLAIGIATLAVCAGVGVSAVAGPGGGALKSARVNQASSSGCTPAFSDPSADAPDATGTQSDQLDIVQFDFGLDATGTKLRTVMTIKNLSTTLPTGATSMSYTMYWTYNGTNYATSAVVDSAGAVTYSDGTITLTGGNTNYAPKTGNGATGTFGSGANGQVEIDAPLSDVGGPAGGQTLTGTNAFTGSDVGANGSSVGQTLDADGPGNDYTLGQTTCLSSGGGGGSTPTPTATPTGTPTSTPTPTPTPTTSPTYYFHGTSTDDANRVEVVAGQASPSATFDANAPTATSATGVSQTAAFDGNQNQSANSLSIYWYGNFSGNVSGDLYLDWYWSTANPAALSSGDVVTITAWADPSTLIATTNPQLVQATAKIAFGNPTAPVLNHTVIALPSKCPCTVKSKLLIQVSSDTYVDTGHANTVNYDSTAVASAFHFGPGPSSGGSTAPVSVGSEAFANYGSPQGYQTVDGIQRENSGEPSIGSNWSTGNILYMAGTQVSQIHFDTTKTPPAATWADVTPAQLANASEDSILFTDNQTNRTWAEDFLLNPTCNANIAYTDSDGGSGGGPTASATNTSWTPEQCPYETGVDHPSVGAGPYFGTPPPTAVDTKEIVYYCSQTTVTPGGAFCTHSENGGLTWDPSTHVFGTGSPCGAIHGHIRVSPDGTMYVPQNSCGGHQGLAYTQDNGSTYSYSVIPDSNASVTDPSVAADTKNTIYFGYEDGSVNSQPKIAISKDHGGTWSPSVNVGKPFGLQNVVFPEVIAGDPGRAAFAFLGTTTGGDYQAQSFRGVWYLYIAYTYDGGNSWQVVNATPNDPVQRGCVDNGGATSGYAGCRNMLDFNDITVDKQGRVYVAYTDGCTTDPSNTYSCDTNANVDDSGCATHSAGPESTYSEGAPEYSTATCTYGRQAALVRQVCGQGLFASHDPGFSESSACAPTPNTPETPAAVALLGAGGLAAGLAAIAGRRRFRNRWVDTA